LELSTYPEPPTLDQQARFLKDQAAHLEDSLNEVRKRIAELEAAQKREG
jgi:hypothetical protein